MNFNTFVSSSEDIRRCVGLDRLTEVLIEPVLLAREGTLSLAAAWRLAEEARQAGLRPVLVWDALMPEQVMVAVCGELDAWDLRQFAAVRVSDMGVAHWLLAHYPALPIQLLMETGNHNIHSLQGWCDFFGDALDRLVLSIELPEEKLVDYAQTLPVGCEVLGVGRILLFYSPRSLLAQHVLTQEDAAQKDTAQETIGQKAIQHIETAVITEKHHDRLFPTVETPHGTFMFLDKDQFILDRLDKLAEAGLHMVRLDVRHLSTAGDAATDIDVVYAAMHEQPQKLRRQWQRPTRAPFFRTNKTTAQFGRLKSKRYAYRDESVLAEIVAIENGRYIVFQALQNFEIEQAGCILLSTGETLMLPSDLHFRSLDGTLITQPQDQQLFTSGWVKKAVPGSLLQSK
ncbi:MAG: U32 family peptidase [Chloroflexota bacterium]